MITDSEIRLLAQVHKQIGEKVDLTKPLPQTVEIDMAMNFVVEKPISSFMLYVEESEL